MTHPEQKTTAEENNDFVLVRIRVPRYIYRSLCIMSAKRDLKFTRFVIELLRTVVHKDYEKEQEIQSQLDDIVE